jgi:hypothetical protein
MTKITSYLLRCVGSPPLYANHDFIVDVERPEDITTSAVESAFSIHSNPEAGYALLRDRTFARCPYCDALCKVMPGSITQDIKFTPSKDSH